MTAKVHQWGKKTMDIYTSRVKFIYDNLKIDPNKFGLAGEVYYKQTSVNPEVQQYSSLINKYVSINIDGFYVNRKPIYFSSYFNDTEKIISEVPEDYNTLLKSDICIELKRYLLFTFTEYIMSSICKLLNLCFTHKDFKKRFYDPLKNYVIDLSQLLVCIQFNDNFHLMKSFNESTLNNIVLFAKEMNVAKIREHVEMDSKMLLTIGYLLYSDYIKQYDLVLSPLLGASQIPPFFNALNRFINKNDLCQQSIPFEYIKYSTYEEDGSDCFITIAEQRQWLSEKYSSSSKVLLIDESLGTGTTVLKIKEELSKYFTTVDTAAIEYRWDKKIIWNTDREWFNINEIDYISPIYYRHYLLLDEQILNLKNERAPYQPYVPFAVYDDVNYHTYIAKQSINEKNKVNMDNLFYRTRIIKEILYTNGGH